MEIRLLCLFLIFSQTGFTESFDATIATKLRKKLLKNYDKAVVPQWPNTVIQSYVDVGLSQIVHLDSVSESAKLYIWYRQHWIDERLTWNESEYKVDYLSFLSSEVWKPDLTIYNQFPDADTRDLYPLYVFSNGHIKWHFPRLIDISCGMNMQFFPFDTQICKVIIASWVFSTQTLNISTMRTDVGDMSNFVENVEWDCKGMFINPHGKLYSSGKEYGFVTFSVIMRRRPLFYIANLVIPCMVILAVHFLGFLLPPASGEKISLGITALLAFTVNLLMIASSLPPGSRNIPIMAKFFGICIVIMGWANGCEVISLNLYHRGEYGERPPKWVRIWILGKIGRFLRITKLPLKKCNDSAFSNVVHKGTEDHNTDTMHGVSSNHENTTKEEVDDGEICKDELNLEWSLVSLVVTRITMMIYFMASVCLIGWFFITPPPFKMPDPEEKEGY